MPELGEGSVIKGLGNGTYLIKVKKAEIVANDVSVPRLVLAPGDLVILAAFDTFQKGARIIGLAGTPDEVKPDAKVGRLDETFFDGEEVQGQ